MAEYAPEIQAGETTYVLTSIDGKSCYVAKGMETDNAFTFQCKPDRETKRTMYVNLVSRAKYSSLPDVSNLEEPEPLEGVIEAGSTRYVVGEIENTTAYFPDSMGADAPLRFVWYPKLDRLNSRHFFVNAETRAKAWMLPEIADHRERVLAMLRRYDPAAAKAADATVEAQYGGEWKPFLDALVAKYGKEPGAIRRDTRERLVAIFGKFCPQELPHVDAWLDKHEGQEEELIASLTSQYGFEPPTYRQRITAIYQKYNPEKLSSVDDGLRMYAGKELMLIAALVKKYGPEPGEQADALREKTPEELAEFRRRVTAMYTRYNPSKLNSVEQGLEMYKGQEELLMEALITKYGPEPTGETPEEAIGKHPEPISASSVADSDSAAQQLDSPVFKSVDSPPGKEPRPVEPSTMQPVPQMPSQHVDPAPTEPTEAATQPVEGVTDDAGDAAIDEAAEEVADEEVEEEAEEAHLSAEELEAYRRRVVAILNKYKPGRVDQADKLLDQYAGNEEALIVALVAKYGPEPGPQSDSEEDPAVTKALSDLRAPKEKTYEERVAAIYAHYAPQSMNKVAKALQMYEDKEQLLEALAQKYGPEPHFGASTDHTTEPTPTATSEELPTAAPEQQQHLPSEKVHASEEEPTPVTVVHAPPQDAPQAEDVRTQSDTNDSMPMQLVATALRDVAPTETAPPAVVVTSHEEQPPATAPVPVQPAPASQSQPQPEEDAPPADDQDNTVKLTPQQLAAYRSRVEAIFRLYKPSQLHTVDSLMQRYEGQEEFLMEALRGRYGPEPPALPDVKQLIAESLADQRLPTEKSTKERVVAIYARYAPDFVVKGLAAVERYADHQELIDVLVTKYGPEPYFGPPQEEEKPATDLTVAVDPAAAAPGELSPRDASAETEPPASATEADAPSFAEAAVAPITTSASMEIPPPAHPAPTHASAASTADEGGNDETSTVAQSVAPAPGTYRERVMRFYLHYKPKKASDAIVDRALAMYRGQEEELIEELERKFGPEPPADSVLVPHASTPDPLSFDKNTNPDDIPASLVPNFVGMMKSATPADQLYGTMMIRKTLSSSNPPANAIVQESIMPTLVDHMKLGTRNKDLAFEAAWCVVLLAFTSAPHGPLDLQPGCRTLSERERITALYQKYAPDGLNNLNAMLSRYGGQENVLIDILVRRHGPEELPPQQKHLAEALIAQFCPDMPQARVVAALAKFEKFEDVFATALRMRYEGVDSQATPLHSPWSAAGEGDQITTPLAGSTVTTPMATPRDGATAVETARPVSRMSDAELKRRDEEAFNARANLEDEAVDTKETTSLAESNARRQLTEAFNAKVKELHRVEALQQLQHKQREDFFHGEFDARRSIMDEEYAQRLADTTTLNATKPVERPRALSQKEAAPVASPPETVASPPREKTPQRSPQQKPAPVEPSQSPPKHTEATTVATQERSPDQRQPSTTAAPKAEPAATGETGTATAVAAGDEPTPVRELRRVIRETVIVDADPAVIAARDAHHLSIIGALATFEVRLREAYDKLNGAMSHSDALREENVRLSALLAEVRASTHTEVEAARSELEEARRAAREIEREAELARATMKTNISVSASAAQHELELERLKAEEMKLEHAKLLRALHEEINTLHDRRRESEQHSLHLTNRLKVLGTELAEANNAIELLTAQLAVQRPKADASSQWCEEDFTPKPSTLMSAAETEQRSRSPLRDQRLQVARLTTELEEWKSLAARLKAELRSAERQHQELINAPCEECDTASLVIGALRDKNAKLEAELQQLEMTYAAGPAIYSRADDGESLRIDISRLKQMLAEANATTRSQRAEIQDLRGLLAIHMASPPAKRR